MPRSKEGKKRPIPSSAVADVLERGSSIRKSAIEHGISKSALAQRISR